MVGQVEVVTSYGSDNRLFSYDHNRSIDIGTAKCPANNNCTLNAPPNDIKSKRFSKQQILFLVILGFANFFVAVTYSLLAPFYPAEAERKGATATEYGLVFGVYELAVFVTSPIFGVYLHSWGPKFVYNAGLLVTGVSTALFGFLDTFSNHLLFVTFSFLIRIFAALGDAAFTCASFSIIANEFPNCVATTFASLETFFGLGLIVGPTLGGALYETGGFQLPFISVGVTVLASAFLACIFFPIKGEETEEVDPNAPGIVAAAKVPHVLLAACSILNGALSLGFLSATLEPHIRQFDLNPILTGSMFIIHGGIYALTAPLWGWLCDSLIHPKLLSLVGAIVIFIGFLFIGPAPFVPFDTVLWVTCVGLAIYGLGIGITMVTSFIMALEEAVQSGFQDNIHTYGVISALWNSFFALGAFIGPSVGGFLLDQAGFRWATLFVLLSQVLIAVWTLYSMDFSLSKYYQRRGQERREMKIEKERLLKVSQSAGPSTISHILGASGGRQA